MTEFLKNLCCCCPIDKGVIFVPVLQVFYTLALMYDDWPAVKTGFSHDADFVGRGK
jgi:hypothetical protein